MKIRRPVTILTAALLTAGLGALAGAGTAGASEAEAPGLAVTTGAADAAAPDDGTLVLAIVGGTLGFILLSFVFAIWLGRRILRGSKKKRAEFKRLLETGHKARATILGIDPTGLVMNEINVQCRVRFRVEPLDRSASFEGEKKAYINQTRMPRVGDVWPCWYDHTDRSRFVVGQPDLGDPSSTQLLADFGC